MKLNNLIYKSQTQVSTCNAWGFGGITGTKTVYSNGLIRISGRNHYRHLPSTIFNEFCIMDNGYEIAVGNIDLLLLNIECSVYAINYFSDRRVKLPFFCVGTSQADVLKYYRDGKHTYTSDDVLLIIK